MCVCSFVPVGRHVCLFMLEKQRPSPADHEASHVCVLGPKQRSTSSAHGQNICMAGSVFMHVCRVPEHRGRRLQSHLQQSAGYKQCTHVGVFVSPLIATYPCFPLCCVCCCNSYVSAVMGTEVQINTCVNLVSLTHRWMVYFCSIMLRVNDPLLTPSI